MFGKQADNLIKSNLYGMKSFLTAMYIHLLGFATPPPRHCQFDLWPLQVPVRLHLCSLATALWNPECCILRGDVLRQQEWGSLGSWPPQLHSTSISYRHNCSWRRCIGSDKPTKVVSLDEFSRVSPHRSLFLDMDVQILMNFSRVDVISRSSSSSDIESAWSMAGN